MPTDADFADSTTTQLLITAAGSFCRSGLGETRIVNGDQTKFAYLRAIL